MLRDDDDPIIRMVPRVERKLKDADHRVFLRIALAEDGLKAAHPNAVREPIFPSLFSVAVIVMDVHQRFFAVVIIMTEGHGEAEHIIHVLLEAANVGTDLRPIPVPAANLPNLFIAKCRRDKTSKSNVRFARSIKCKISCVKIDHFTHFFFLRIYGYGQRLSDLQTYFMVADLLSPTVFDEPRSPLRVGGSYASTVYV